MYSLELFFLLTIVICDYTVGEWNSESFKFYPSGNVKLGHVGQKIVLSCPFSASFYLWRLYTSNQAPRVLFDKDTKQIEISKAKIDDSGVYECKSTSGFGNAVINITVKIVDPNYDNEDCKAVRMENKLKGLCFVSPKDNQKTQFDMNSRIIMDCQAAGNDVKYIWTYIKNGRHQTFPVPTNVSKIEIKSLKAENVGDYHCEVIDRDKKKLSRKFKIDMLDKSKNIEVLIDGKQITDVLPNGIKKIMLTCDVKAKYNQIHSVKWGKRLPSNTRPDSLPPGTVINWNLHHYRLLSNGVEQQEQTDKTRVFSTLRLLQDQQQQPKSSNTYICVAVTNRGATNQHIFKINGSGDAIPINNNDDSTFSSSPRPPPNLIILYILLPAVVIFILIAGIICCCIRHKRIRHGNIGKSGGCGGGACTTATTTTTSSAVYHRTPNATAAAAAAAPITNGSTSTGNSVPLNKINNNNSNHNYTQYQQQHQQQPTQQQPFSSTSSSSPDPSTHYYYHSVNPYLATQTPPATSAAVVSPPNAMISYAPSYGYQTNGSKVSYCSSVPNNNV